MRSTTKQRDQVTVATNLTDAQAMALAQFVKRLGWREIRVNAANDDEAYLIREAISATQDELSQQGYNPR